MASVQARIKRLPAAFRPTSSASKSPLLSGIEERRARISGRIELYKKKAGIRINAAEQFEVV